MRKVLVTGGAGYIGSHVVKQLINGGSCDVVILDNLSTGFAETYRSLKSLSPSLRMLEMDLSDWEGIRNMMLLEKFDAVVHFAASLVVPESVRDPLNYYLNNTANTTNLIKCCIEASTNKFIFSSTAAVYGEADVGSGYEGLKGICENAPLLPINPYGFSKMFSERILMDSSFAHPQFRFVALRYFNVAGADSEGVIGQSTLNATHLIKIAAQTAIGSRVKMSIFGDDYPTPDGTCIRDYIHVDDLASAHVKAMDYLDEGGVSNQFNCGYGHGYSVKEVVDVMRRVSCCEINAEIVGRREGDPAILISNNEKIKSVMGWTPKYDNLEYICRTALDWERKITEIRI